MSQSFLVHFFAKKRRELILSNETESTTFCLESGGYFWFGATSLISVWRLNQTCAWSESDHFFLFTCYNTEFNPKPFDKTIKYTEALVYLKGSIKSIEMIESRVKVLYMKE